jgi:putative flippase GtrA
VIATLRRHRIVAFAVVSGLGLTLDYGLYALLCANGTPAGEANLASAATGVTFVFLASVRRIFQSEHRFLLAPFLVYAAYQVVAVSAASWAVGTMTDVLDGAYILGKTTVLPVSFTANYLFMSWLSRQRRLDLGTAS